MIHLKSIHECCGCSACVQRCPKSCISLCEDDEGFLYPKIDASQCVACGICEAVCPVLNQSEPMQPLYCYAAVNPDETIRMQSSSGGIFSMLAESIIKEGGVVFGAKWNKEWQVIHSYTDSIAGLSEFRGSKYVQSIIGNSYKDAEYFLKSGRKVLFSGTPCQIKGLTLYLRKGYKNLITVDFICHGVPSPGVFRWYLQEEICNYSGMGSISTGIFKGNLTLPEGVKINSINFRDKSTGWKNFSISFVLTDERFNEKRYIPFSDKIDQSPYGLGFLNNYYLRPSCYKCPCKQLKSQADITLADYWGYKSSSSIIDDDKGVSAVLISSKKGRLIFESIHSHHEKVQYEDITHTNGAVIHSVKGPYRTYFFRNKKNTFKYIIKKLSSTNFFDRVSRKLYLITHRHEY